MAEVTLASASERQAFGNQFWREYVRQTRFMPYMGKSETSIFRILRGSETGGASIINIPLLGVLKGRGVQGSEVLEGNEEDLENFNDQVRTIWYRNGVVVPKSTSYRTELDILGAAKPSLRDWAANLLKAQVVNAMQSIIIPGAADENGQAGTDTAKAYADASASERNTFLANNDDRILFGAALSNNASNVWASSLANIDNTADKLTPQLISLAKRRAKLADPAIEPYRDEEGREYFVLFAHPLAFRDLRNNSDMMQANRDARARGIDNPIFQDGDLIWDGVIITEAPELTVTAGAGAGGIDVVRNFMCGRNALALAWEQQPTLRMDTTRDFQFRPAVGIEELRGQKKVSRGGTAYGVVEVITAAVADA